ncbi:MAG: hypothetical protein Q7R47_04010 [Candidatus Diapherotrites archaeon]|nr:hypothetical protein [Candidatus Diapherotrites archaeon]
MIQGQISIEAIVVVVFLLIFLGLTISSTLQVQSFERLISDSSADQALCLKTADIVQEIFLSGAGTRAVFEVDRPVSVAASSITVNQTYCYFSGVAVPVSLSKGSIVVSNSSGVVSLANS